MKNNKIYYYPLLSKRDLIFFRIGGPGLANCMFFVAKAYINSLTGKREGVKNILVAPTWKKLSIGPIIRKERDKRFYSNIFKSDGLSGIQKFWFLIKQKIGKTETITFNSLGNYFTDLTPFRHVITEYFKKIVNTKAIENVVGENLRNYIAIHVRLGDYNANQRIPLSWYKGLIENILKFRPTQQFILFSDGSDEELNNLLKIDSVERKFYGNAFADMFAISKCKMVIASDSTFSAWGAFLGNVPIVFNRRHFPPVFNNSEKEFVIGDNISLSPKILKYI